jgi:hypothetical protein
LKCITGDKFTSKSPRTVAVVALAAGKEAFSDYSHVYSPHKFTQPAAVCLSGAQGF